MKFWKNILKKQFHEKTTAVIFVVVFLLLMIPIVLDGKYCCPQMDDYGYSTWTYHSWKETHNIFTVLEVAFVQARVTWYTWQGTFSSIFMMALNPAIFDYRLYKLVPAMMIFFMSLSCFALSRLLIGEI